jgi:hypothetical protein
MLNGFAMAAASLKVIVISNHPDRAALHRCGARASTDCRPSPGVEATSAVMGRSGWVDVNPKKNELAPIPVDDEPAQTGGLKVNVI